MRKLLDWIADKLGYQRKFAFKPRPPTYIPASVMKEWEDDNCLPPDYFHNMMKGILLQPTGTHETDPFIVKD